jgi:hypothetical protein
MRSEVEEHPPEDYLSDASHSGGLCSLRGACPHLESESPEEQMHKPCHRLLRLGPFR